MILADSLTDADDAPPQLTAATSHVPTVRDSDVLGKLRSKMLSRIAARAGGGTPAAGAVIIANAADAGSWENQEAEEMAKGMAAWRKVQARRRRRLHTHRSDDESSSILSLFLLTSAVCSLAFFVFDFVSWDCT